MDPKPRPNHQRYLEILSRMTPEQRILKAFELTEMTRQLCRDGLRTRYPEASEAEIDKLLRDWIDRCRNSNYSRKS